MDLNVKRILMLTSSYGLQTAISSTEYTHIPFSLTPCEFDEQRFNELAAKTSEFSKVMLKISKNNEYMYSVLQEVCAMDEFTRNLVNLSKKAKTEGAVQKVFLGITRNDFMFDRIEKRFIQVEYNTISASFIHLSSKIADFHRHLQGLKNTPIDAIENPATVKCADAFELAYKLNGGKGFVLFIVLANETNLFDQTGLELELWKRGLPVIRASLEEVGAEAKLSEEKELIYKKTEISIVYFRAGYMPEQYPSELSWQGREKIELSKAIKCPDINFHLAGCKKIQQSLNTDMPLFTSDSMSLLHNTTEIYDFSKLSPEVIQRVRNNPQDWVLKPQREGGGNNTYGENILPKLENFERHPEYILMKMIKCEEKECDMVRAGVVNRMLAVSELGMFGALVVDGEEIVMNEYAGYLVRTKSKDSNEGGIAAGYAVIDSARLVSKLGE